MQRAFEFVCCCLVNWSFPLPPSVSWPGVTMWGWQAVKSKNLSLSFSPEVTWVTTWKCCNYRKWTDVWTSRSLIQVLCQRELCMNFWPTFSSSTHPLCNGPQAKKQIKLWLRLTWLSEYLSLTVWVSLVSLSGFRFVAISYFVNYYACTRHWSCTTFVQFILKILFVFSHF